LKIDVGQITIGGDSGMNVTGMILRLGNNKILDDSGTNVAGTIYRAPVLATIDIKNFQTFVSGSVTVFAH
jgi:hypothetical protein